MISHNQVQIQEFYVRMPGNYILEYGALPIFFQNKLLEKAEIKLDIIISAILKKEPTKRIKPNLLAKLSKQKGLEKPKEFHKLGMQFNTNKNCSLCRNCVVVCPVDNIAIINNAVTWLKNRQQCMACIQWCPEHAIEHPLLKANRKRYTNPYIKRSEMQVTLYE